MCCTGGLEEFFLISVAGCVCLFWQTFSTEFKLVFVKHELNFN